MLTISLDTKSRIPIYEQIYKYIREEIKKGNITCGKKLPSSRGLAIYLEVSRNTVDMAYGQLQSEGYIESIPKKGFYVCALENLYDEKFSIETSKKRKLEESSNILQKENYQVDFSMSGVDMDYFPYGKWRKLMRECLIDDNKELFLAGNHQGDFALREAVRNYLHQSRGVACDSSQIIIGAGSDYLLLLLSKILEDVNEVAMENPTYKQAYTLFTSMNYTIKPISLDEQGIRMDVLENTNAKLVYVTPSHQFPLGIVMSANRRQQLLAWAGKEKERYIIEDDYDSEFRYFGRPIPALQSQDPFEKVIYIGTLSKAIAPGIRMSYMVLPKRVKELYKKKVDFYFSTVSRIDQSVISQFFLQGYFERHLNRMRKIYKTKHDLLLQEIRMSKISVEVSGENAGLHLLLSFGPKVENARSVEENLVQMAKDVGVKVYPLSDFYVAEERRKPTLLIGFARLKEEEIVLGIQLLKKAWKDYLLLN